MTPTLRVMPGALLPLVPELGLDPAFALALVVATAELD
jgi:hypothetical protein